MLPAIPYGWQSECVAGKCGIFFADIYRARDDLWHMSMAQVAFDTFSFRMPIYAGALLQNYHFLYSLLLSIVTSLGISVNFGYYVALPIVWFTIYTFLTIQIAKKFTSDPKAIPFFLFFSYFSSGLTYLLSLKNTGSFLHDIGWFSNQPGEYLINPTLALSLVLFQLLILTVLSGVRSMKSIFALLVVIFLLWGSKFYGGVIGVSFVTIYLISLVIEKKIQLRQMVQWLVSICLVSLCAVIVFYNPFNSIGKGGVFSLEPFKTIHPMIEDPELFPLLRVARLRYILSENPFIFWPYLMLIEYMTLLLYLTFTYGTRLLTVGLLFMKEKLSPILIAIFGSSIIATIFPVLFTQKGGDWFNTIQFMAYSQFLLQMSLALFAFQLFVQKGRNARIFLILIMFFTFIGALNPIVEYGRNLPVISKLIPPKLFQPRVYVSTQELDALSFLSKQRDGVVFTLPFTPIYDAGKVKPLWKTNDTALVAALGNKQVYITNLQQLDLMGIEHVRRTLELKNLNKINISKLPVQYFYLYKSHPSYSGFVKRLKPYANLLFENKEVGVWGKSSSK
jgi:hypothetical protein